MQIELTIKQRQCNLAAQIAMGKERFKYYNFVFSLALVLLPIAAMQTHNPRYLIPLVPLTTGFCFQYDLYYGTMVLRA